MTALAIALMAAPLASMAAAAVLHGAYYFEWITRPTKADSALSASTRARVAA